jgi:hypothetical protein
MSLSDRQLRFVVADTLEEKRKKFGKDWYVPVLIEKRLAERIPAGRLALHPELKGLPILKMAQGSNFLVLASLEQSLEHLAGQSPAADNA